MTCGEGLVDGRVDEIDEPKVVGNYCTVVDYLFLVAVFLIDFSRKKKTVRMCSGLTSSFFFFAYIFCFVLYCTVAR